MSKISFFIVSLLLVISTSVSAKTITLTWDPSPDANVVGYKVYYKAGSSSLPFNGSGATEGGSPIDVGTILSSTLNGLPDAQIHYLAVTAYDNAGNESVYSNVVTSSAINIVTNQAPVLSLIGSKTVHEGTALSFTLSANDPDGDSLTYSASGLPSGAIFNAATHTFSWTPGTSQAGSYPVNFSVSDGNLRDAETVTITVANTNQAPVLAPIGSKTASAGVTLSFTLSANDPDGDSLTYSASGLPSGAIFNTATRTFSWTPGTSQTGSYNVNFSVSDGSLNDAETVVIAVDSNLLDSDGDGVLDSQDAFPQDPTEWIDTDSDGIGNNADPDDDNDGVVDVQDSAPLDDSLSAWTISAVAGQGGSITPAGDSLLAFGGSQNFTLSATTGFYVSDVLVDGISIGPVTQYEFTTINDNHSIEAQFLPVSDGLSLPLSESGLPGVERADGGDDADNYVNGLPKGDLDYIFRVVLQNATGGTPPNVILKLNGYAYTMSYDSGNINSGATYTFTTKLGPAASQSFHFETRDAAGNTLSRLPTDTEFMAPQVQFLNGKNIVGVPADITQAQLSSVDALGTSLSFRWIPSVKSNGSYEKVDNGGPVISGEGYILKRTTDSVLPSMESYGENSATTYMIPIKTGWNLIANPYGGNVSLSSIRVQSANLPSQSWAEAVGSQQVIDGIYYYAGKDWGNKNIYEGSGGAQGAILIPRIGYWIYINAVNEQLSLVVPKPQQ